MWEKFCGLDLRSLALFRIGLGLLLLVDLAGRWPDLAAHYSDDGVLPRSLVPVYIPIAVHCLNGSVVYQQFLFALAGAFAIALLLGYRTQLATFISWLLLLSLHARNPLVLHGGDLLERLLLFWSIFLPLGARWSRDARAGPTESRPACSVATAALLLQVVFVYWFGLAARNHPAWWGEGTAAADALSLEFYATPLGVWLRGLPPDLLRVGTWTVVAVEGVGPLLLLLSGSLPRLRTAVVAVLVVFHVLLGLALRLGTFPLVCALAWLPFLPAWFWDSLLSRLRKSPTPSPTEEAVPPRSRLSSLATAVVLLSLAYVLLCNCQALDGGFSLALIKGIGLEQSWGMFAPYPSREDGWYVVAARLRDGSEVDPFRGGPVSWEQPARIAALYPSVRWAAYLSLLPRPDYESFRPYFAEYLGRRWNDGHQDGATAESVAVYYMLRFIRPDYTATPPRKVLLAQVDREPSADR